MQILVNFEIEGTRDRQSLPDTTKWISLSRFLLSFTDRLAYSVMQIEMV